MLTCPSAQLSWLVCPRFPSHSSLLPPPRTVQPSPVEAVTLKSWGNERANFFPSQATQGQIPSSLHHPTLHLCRCLLIRSHLPGEHGCWLPARPHSRDLEPSHRKCWRLWVCSVGVEKAQWQDTVFWSPQGYQGESEDLPQVSCSSIWAPSSNVEYLLCAWTWAQGEDPTLPEVLTGLEGRQTSKLIFQNEMFPAGWNGNWGTGLVQSGSDVLPAQWCKELCFDFGIRLEFEFQFCHFWAIWTQESFWAFLNLWFHI